MSPISKPGHTTSTFHDSNRAIKDHLQTKCLTTKKLGLNNEFVQIYHISVIVKTIQL